MLYATNIEDIAKPIPKTSIKKVKKGKENAAPTTPPASESAERGQSRDEPADPGEEKKAAQKAARNAKAALKREAKKLAEIPKEEPVKVAKKRKAASPKQLDIESSPPEVVENNQPPAWFKSFMADTRVNEAKIVEPKKSKRSVRKEAVAEAAVEWQKPEVRERVNNEQDRHLSRMYSQIFKR